ncbi:MAG: family 10 glycosylhydrolase, partial [Bacteroidia bacterium]
MKRIIYSICAVACIGLMALNACKKPTDSTSNPDPIKPPVTEERRREAIVWVDARSNVFGTYGRLNDTAMIKTTLDTLKEVGVTGLVLDLKGSSGYTMYQSNYSPQVTSQDGKSLPAGVDYAGYFIKEAKKRNFKVYASIVTFVEGDRSKSKGKVFEDPLWRDEYQSIVCDVNGNRVPVTGTGKNGFVNPAIPAVQERALNIIKEIVGKYDLDGMLLDYGRYTDVSADFSDYSKNDFIKFLENKYQDSEAKKMSFPSDIVTSWKITSDQVVPNATGKYYKRWLLYRATVIHDFFVKARAAVKSVKPTMKFGTYVGAWYTTYYQVGVNWASQDYDPFNDQEVKFDWSYPDYNKTGYAEQVDLLMTGNYFTQL